jgi:two-component system copper resistance phosphate regulon response regulator CusR
MMRILVIEDEPKVASFIKRGLEENDHSAEVALDGMSGLSKVLSNDYGLVILDVNIPCLNGYQVCRKIREQKNVPILMLTALGSLDDKITGLDAGADDYLLKPFEFQELLARIRALSRRNKLVESEKNILKMVDLEINTQTKAVTRNHISIDLTAKEYYLLEYLMKNHDKVLTRAEIAENVWNLHFDTGTNIIDVYINYLRKKIDKDFSPKLIHTLVGLGYVMKNEQ